MLVKPEVLHRSRPGDGVAELTLAIAASLPYFRDHFPGQPMLPGVVQLGWAVRCAQDEFGIDAPVRRIGPLKFQHPIGPGDAVTLRLERQDAHTVAFTYDSPRGPYSNGRLAFA
jgi:3-hydroxyacyl-[acyl-carrier-protein] dehydratase